MSSNKYNVASVEKAVAIIDYVAQRGGATFKEICVDTDFAKASIYTILQTCLSHNLLKLGQDKKYRLGTKLLYWGYTMERDIEITSVSEQILSELARELQVSIHMGQMIDGRAVFVKKYDGALYTIKTTVLGQEAMFHCQCTAKVLLAYQPEEVQEQIINSIDYPAFTSRTIVTTERLRAELAQIRADGFAYDNRERSEDIIGIGVPVFNWDKEVVAAVSIGYIGSEITREKKEHFVQRLQEASRRITGNIGNRGNA